MSQPPSRESAGRRPRQRAALVLAAVVATVVGACRSGQPAAKVPTPAAPSGAPSGAPKAGAPIDTSRTRDTTTAKTPSTADSVSKVATTDTAARDGGKTPPKKKPAPATRNCVMDLAESPPETRLLYQRISEGVSNTFVGGGFVGRCQGENNRLRADSAEQFEAAGIINLFGNVTYEEPGKMQVRASHAIYFTREGRLFADGGVVATQVETGSTFTGASMEYYRATAERPVSKLVAPMRSTATLIEKDSATGKPGAPTSVTANRFEDAGDSLLFAWGDVLIVREKLTGRADSSMFDKLSERSRLIRGARITNSDSARKFTLVGDTIDLFSTNRQLERVLARHKSKANTDEMQLDAELIDLRLKDQQLTEAFAFGPGRARAKTGQQDVDADSLRIRMVEKVVREVHAVGGARAVGAVDSMKIRSPEKDLLRGDSIFAYFDSSATAVKDTVNGPAVKEIRALGTASSLFHIASTKGRDAKPSINYVRGARIYVNFDTGAVRTVRVDSQASGIFVEPEDSVVVDTAAARKDSAATRGRGNAKTTPPAGAKSAPPAKPPVPVKPPMLPMPADASAATSFVALAFRRRRS